MNHPILAEIHQAIRTLGGSATPTSPPGAVRELRALGAPDDLLSIVDTWWERTLDDDLVLEMLRDWNAGRPLFKQVFASDDETMRR